MEQKIMEVLRKAQGILDASNATAIEQMIIPCYNDCMGNQRAKGGLPSCFYSEGM